MLFANVVGDVIWIVMCMVFFGFCAGLYWLGYWIWYICHNTRGRAKIAHNHLAKTLIEEKKELSALKVQVTAKEVEVQVLEDKVLAWKNMAQ
jgi:hypothetical protein